VRHIGRNALPEQDGFDFARARGEA